MNVHTKFEVRSFTRSWDNWLYPQNLGSPWIRPCSLFSKIFNGHLFLWTLGIYRPNLKSVALPVREIIATGLLVFGVGLQPPNLGEQEAVGDLPHVPL